MERRAMRKVVGSLFQSLDGVIQAPGASSATPPRPSRDTRPATERTC